MPRRLAAVRSAAGAADRGFAAFERALVVVLLALMVGAVVLDAMHRVFAAGEGRLERLLVALTPDLAHAAVRAVVAPGLLLLATFGALYGAVRTREPAGRRRRAALLAATFALAL